MTAISATGIRTLTRSTCVPLGSSPSPSVFCLAKISLLCHQNTKMENDRPKAIHGRVYGHGRISTILGGNKKQGCSSRHFPHNLLSSLPPPLPVAPTPQPHLLHAPLATQNSTTKSETSPPYPPTTHQHPHPHSLFPALASSSAASHPSRPAPSASPSPAQ